MDVDVSDAVEFKKEVVAALENCWGLSYPADAKHIKAFLEEEWHKLVRAENKNKAKDLNIQLLEKAIVSMVINKYVPQKEIDDYLKTVSNLVF